MHKGVDLVNFVLNAILLDYLGDCFGYEVGTLGLRDAFELFAKIVAYLHVVVSETILCMALLPRSKEISPSSGLSTRLLTGLPLSGRLCGGFGD